MRGGTKRNERKKERYRRKKIQRWTRNKSEGMHAYTQKRKPKHTKNASSARETADAPPLIVRNIDNFKRAKKKSKL